MAAVFDSVSRCIGRALRCNECLSVCPSVHSVGRSYPGHCGEFQRLLPNPNALVAVSKGMRAAKLRTNKILQFFAGDTAQRRLSDLYNGRKTVIVVVVVDCAAGGHIPVGIA